MFWNIGQSEAAEAIGVLCHQYQVDVLLLAEASFRMADALRQLNTGDGAPYWELRAGGPSQVRLLTRYPRSSVTPIFDDGRVSIRNLRLPIGPEGLIVAAHLPSKLQSDDRDQYHRIRRLRQNIEEAEAKVGHRNSIVIGDLNANPFEDAIVAADGLHGVMDKEVARRASRNVQGRPWQFFYNPMWSRLGDDSKGPPGTYYYARGGLVSYFWNTLDQVLLRPSLLPYYSDDGLIVVSQVGGTDILAPGRAVRGSPDHLSIMVKLSIETEQFDG